ncbi:MAG: hypothetical protein EBZ48_05945, partial [Proteobacteria bacterium]|nr:hypothetical protein [Pseudomonadota bacterium]
MKPLSPKPLSCSLTTLTKRRAIQVRCGIAIVSSALLVTTIVGCSKGDKETGSQATGKTATASQALLSAVPAGALVVNTVDLATSGYQRLKAGPYGGFMAKLQGGSLGASADNPSIPGAKSLSKILQSAQDTGLLPSFDSNKTDTVSALVGFLSQEPALQPGSSAAPGI